MASSKFVLKCGKFAVLVELHILPQGSSKDTSWFSDHQKEEVSLMLKEAVELRIKRLLETRKQRVQSKQNKECTQTSPLYIKGQNFRVACYFMRRHINLRCVLKEQRHELRVFPDRLVVCMSANEAESVNWKHERQALDGNVGSGFSQYFAGCDEDKERLNVSMTVQKKEAALKHVVKKTKSRKGKEKKPEKIRNISEVSVTSERRRTFDKEQTLMTATVHSFDTEVKHIQQPKHCVEEVKNSSRFQILEPKNCIDERQPDEDTSQMLACAGDHPNIELEKRNSLFSSELARPNPEHSQAAGSADNKQRKHCSEDNMYNAKKAFLGKEELNSSENKLFPAKLSVKISPIKSLLQTSMRKLPLQSSSYTKKDIIKTTSVEELLTLENSPLRPLFMKNNPEKTNQNKPTTNTHELSVLPVSSHSEIKCRPSEEFFQEKMECEEYVPRKLKLQRQKKP